MADKPERRLTTRELTLSLVAIVVGMAMMAYASVPLYRLFCQATGFGGTTQDSVQAPDKVLDKEITVRFNADVDPNLSWEFAPEQRSVKVKIGQETTIYYRAKNTGGEESTATAAFNVTPNASGPYFSKLKCFCYEKQTLKPGQDARFAVVFYVDPAIIHDPDVNDIDTITLSYTFFKVEPKKP